MKAVRDLVFGLFVALLGGAYAFQATRIPTSLLSDGVGAGGMPFMLGLVMAALGLALALRSAIVQARGQATPVSANDRFLSRAHLKGSLLLFVGVGYVLMVPIVGYLVGIFLLIGVTAITAGLRPRPRDAFVAAGLAAILAFVFVTLMHTNQPDGLLPLKLPMLRF